MISTRTACTYFDTKPKSEDDSFPIVALDATFYTKRGGFSCLHSIDISTIKYLAGCSLIQSHRSIVKILGKYGHTIQA